MKETVYVRLGDGGEYEPFQDVWSAADSLAATMYDLGVNEQPAPCTMGFEIGPFHGNNYVSLYIEEGGDECGDGNPRELTADEWAAFAETFRASLMACQP